MQIVLKVEGIQCISAQKKKQKLPQYYASIPKGKNDSETTEKHLTMAKNSAKKTS